MTGTKVRLPDELVARIDEARGAVPRERWVRLKLEELLPPPSRISDAVRPPRPKRT